MAKPRVLIFIDWFLPGSKSGGPVRSVANLLAHLGNEFEFSVITRNTDYTSTKPYESVKADAWNETEFGARVYYVSEANLNRETIERLLKETPFDHVYLNGIWSQPFTIWPLEYMKRNGNSNVTVAVRGMLAPSALAIKGLKKKAFLWYAKWKGFFRSVTFHATTAKEAKEVRKAFGDNAKVKVAGNLPRKMHAVNFQRQAKVKGKVRMVNIARIAPEKNTLFAIECLRHAGSQCGLDIWGPYYDNEYAMACEYAAKNLPGNSTVRFNGPMDAHEILKTLSQFDLLFMPTRGENFGHVILEALQVGTPVLISDQTPWKNLAERKAGWDVSLVDRKDFGAIIDEVAAMDETEFSAWSRGAKEFAERYANDEKLIQLSRALFLKAEH